MEGNSGSTTNFDKDIKTHKKEIFVLEQQRQKQEEGNPSDMEVTISPVRGTESQAAPIVTVLNKFLYWS